MVIGDTVPAHPQSASDGVSRRDLLAGVAATAGALLLGGCGSSAAPRSAPTPTSTSTPAPPSGARDVAILSAALGLERRTIAAYTAAIPQLPAAQATWARAFLTEELTHAGVLIGLIEAAGATGPAPADSYDIGNPHDAGAVVEVLASLEALQVERYLHWIARLSPGAARAAAGSILANDAQHVMTLRAARGRPSLGSAFVLGTPGRA